MTITADSLLAGLKRRIIVPSNQAMLTTQDFLAFADDMISSRIVPLMVSVNQNFFVNKTTTPLVQGQNEYSIPYRAIARGLRELKIADPNNNIRNLALVALEDAQLYQSSTLMMGFYFEGDKFHMVPNVINNSEPNLTLQLWWEIPPNKLIQASEASLVISVSDDDVTVNSVPSTITAGVLIDFIQGQSGNAIYSIDQTVTNVSDTTISFGSNVVPSSLQAGDWIANAGYSPVVNYVPNECYSLLESYLAVRVLKSLGDFEGAKVISEEDIPVEEKNCKMILEPRIDGEPTIIINRYSLVRGNRWAQRSWLYGNG